MPNVLEQIKVAVGVTPPPQEQTLPQQLLRQVDEATTLTWRQRIIGFAVCLGVGVLLSFFGMFALLTWNVRNFAILYTFGAICSLCSTLFLMGPCKQLKNMMDKGRILATAVYLGAITITLLVAFRVENRVLATILILICLVIQFIAMAWYCITYIPGGQAFVSGMFGRG